jgi:hypothetical protein
MEVRSEVTEVRATTAGVLFISPTLASLAATACLGSQTR